MRREISRWRALANAAFVLALLGLAGFGVAKVAGRRWQWQETFRARAEFARVGGVGAGDSVRIQGIDAGVVEAVLPPEVPGGPVVLILRIDARLRPLVRADASARIAMQGVVGAKVIEIAPGTPAAPPLPPGGTLRSEAPIEVADLLADARGTLARVDAVAAAAREGLAEVNAIAAAINRGEGSLGRLVKDEAAYRSLVDLSERGEKTLTDLEENLAALKRTWPLSRYFNDRAFFDRDRVLYQPGAEREERVLPADALFEPGRSVLTAEGRRRLDEVAAWFQKTRRRNTEVVIAAYTDRAGGGEDLAQVLTQEQANAVRRYLIEKHAIDSLGGWGLFGSRRVAAVGFGTQAPRPEAGGVADDRPPRRVEVILFTPQV